MMKFNLLICISFSILSGASALRIDQKPEQGPTLAKLNLDKIDLTGCRRVFLDIGSNVGVHVREVFEGAKYPRAKLRQTFTAWFGEEKNREQTSEESGVCAIGFEANPRIAPRLADIESAYAKKGWKAFFFAPQAASDKDGHITMYVNEELGHNDWGSSIVDRRGTGRKFVPTTIRSLDFAAVLEQEIIAKYPQIEKVYAKMDIEGAEFLVIPKMLQGKGLCKRGGIEAMTIEWHDGKIPAPAGCKLCNRKDALEAIKKQSQCAATDVLEVDDEVYLFDPIPLPGAEEALLTVPDINQFKDERKQIWDLVFSFHNQ